jgi:hypothetical protein
MTTKTVPGYILLGDKPTIHTVWPNEPFSWKFGEWDNTQPPGFMFVDIGIDNVWATEIDGQRRFPNDGDIIQYDASQKPVGIIPGPLTQQMHGIPEGGS